MRRVIHTTAAVLAAVVAYVLVTLPPRRLVFPAPPATVVAGAYHVHTTRSDGAQTPAAMAATAARAGLRFVILSDHGDATRAPDAPRYVDGVLMIDAVEISAVEGHVIALGLHAPAPYRLAGEARDVIDDIHRLGGFAIVAHPDSPRPELRWRAAGPTSGPRGAAVSGDLIGADGIEWTNADSEWRDERWPRVAIALLHMPVRPAETFTTLLDRPTLSLRRWDIASRRRTVVGLGAVDAHGKMPGLNVTVFKALAQAVQLSAPLSGDAMRDAAAVLDAVRAGHTFSVLTGIGSVVEPQLVATDDTQHAGMGDRLSAPLGAVRVRASVAAATARVVLRHNDRVVAEGTGAAETTGPVEPGAYRMEAWLGDHRVPWIVTNPVYVGDAPTPSTRIPPSLRDVDTVPLPFGAAWASEHSPASAGVVAVGARAADIDWTWQLGSAQPAIEFSALAHPVQDDANAFDRITFTASADTPTRLWVQFRMPNGHDERWGRSIYVDATPRPITVRMSELTPQGFSANRRPVTARIKAVLFVVDTLNTPPGRRGTVHLSDVVLRRSEPVSGANGEQQVGRAGEEQQVGRPSRQGGR